MKLSILSITTITAICALDFEKLLKEPVFGKLLKEVEANPVLQNFVKNVPAMTASIERFEKCTKTEGADVFSCIMEVTPFEHKKTVHSAKNIWECLENKGSISMCLSPLLENVPKVAKTDVETSLQFLDDFQECGENIECKKQVSADFATLLKSKFAELYENENSSVEIKKIIDLISPFIRLIENGNVNINSVSDLIDQQLITLPAVPQQVKAIISSIVPLEYLKDIKHLFSGKLTVVKIQTAFKSLSQEISSADIEKMMKKATSLIESSEFTEMMNSGDFTKMSSIAEKMMKEMSARDISKMTETFSKSEEFSAVMKDTKTMEKINELMKNMNINQNNDVMTDFIKNFGKMNIGKKVENAKKKANRD